MPHSRQTEKTVRIEVDVIVETEKAYLLSDGNVKEWVPKSQVTLHDEGFNTEAEMSESLARDKGFTP